MKETMTRLGSPTRLGIQSFRDAWQRLSVALMLVMFTATTAWALSGSGTENDPYVINTVADWNTAAITQQYYDNGSSYVYIKLGNDLNFTNKTFNIYGLSVSGLATARMIRFDGQGHTISGITISKTNSNEVAALFGGLSAGGSISHLTVANSSFQAYKYVAGIVADNGGTVSDCHVASTVTLKVGYTYCGGIVARNYTPNSSTGGTVTGCTVGACLQLPSYTMNKVALGGIVGDQNSAGTISDCLFYGSMEVYKNGTTTLFGCITESNYGTITGNCYCPVGTYHAFREGSDTDGTVVVSVVSGIPDGATVSSAATYTYGGNTYCAQNATATITAATNTAFMTFSVSGATGSSVAADKKSATVTLGTNDVTITATLQAIGGSCGANATWNLDQDDSGNYTRLTISGTGEMDDYQYETVNSLWRTKAPWGWETLTSVTVGDGITRIGKFAFIGAQNVASVTIGSGVTEIAQGAINHCDEMTQITLPAVTSVGEGAFENSAKLERIDFGHNNAVTLATNNAFNAPQLEYIVFPSPAGAVANTATTGNWSGYATKLRAAFGSYLFTATNEGGTAAYKIAIEQDLRNLAAVINANTNAYNAITGSGMTFRQTADITLSQTFTPIGVQGASYKWFRGTYDGGGHTISGLTVNTDNKYAGLFGFVNNGTIKNVVLVSPNVTNNYNNSELYAYAGALAGHLENYSKVENCFVYNPTVSAPNASLKYVGAIVGQMEVSDHLTNTHFYSNADYAIAGYCKIESLTNSGRSRMVTLGSGVTGVSPAATESENGFVYDSKTYYREGVTLTLASNTPAGYFPEFTANSTTFSGNTYTVNGNDVTLTFVKNTPITYTITYHTNDGTLSTNKNSYTVESSTITLDTPTRKGYTFGGWYNNAGLTGTAVTTIDHGSTDNVELWAKWNIITYTITYHTNDGTLSTNKNSYTVESSTITLDTPTRKGYTFGGWYNNAGLTGTAVTTIDHGSTDNMDLWAKWNIITYTITYHTNDGTLSTDKNSYTVESSTITLDTPTRTGYTFGGWYDNAGLTGTAVTTIDHGSTDNVELWAKWDIINYTITYHLDGGSVDNPTSYNVETETFTLNNPTKPGYTFTGWTGSNGTTPQTSVTITKGSSLENLDYTAHYEIACFTEGSLSYEWTRSGTEVKVTACNPSAEFAIIPATVSNDGVTYNVTAIEATAFSGCTSLTTLALKSTTPPALGINALDACTALNAIYVPSGTVGAYKAAAGWSAYKEKIQGYDGTCGTNVYYTYDSSTYTLHVFGTGAIADYNNEYTPWNSYKEEIKTLVIGNGVTSIGIEAFGFCKSLTSIEIPTSVTSIGEKAFTGCTGFTSIDIPASVTSIGFGAFWSCTSLASIEIPASVKSIGDRAFADCESLESIEIPASVTSIGKEVLAYCNALESISVATDNPTYHSEGNCIIETESHTLIQGCKKSVIPDDVASIGETAFYYCASLTSIEIPASVTTISSWAFGYCTNLTSIKIPASVTSIGEEAFAYCESLTSITIPGSVTDIDSWAFGYCTGLTSIIISDGVKRIGNNAFNGCTSLTSVTIPTSVTDIGVGAFGKCTSLESIEIPASVTSIYPAAFASCTSLASVTIYAPELSEYGWHAFENNASGRKIYVFNDCLDTYKAQASEMGVDANDILPIESIVRRGDANADGSISVTDIAVVVNCILQLPNTGGFSEYGADANGDGDITVTDIGVIVDKILGNPTPAPPEGGEPQ